MPKKYQRKQKKTLSSKQIANIAKKAVLGVAETKMLPRENSVTIGADSTAAVFSNLSQLATQGTDNEQRVGDSVLSTGLQFVYSIGAKTEAVDYFVRVILIMADSGEFTSATDTILTDTANDPISPTANDDQDILRSLSRKLFKVVYDKTHSIHKSSGGQGTSMLYRKNFFKLRNKRYFANDAGGDSRDLDNLRCYVFVRDKQGGTIAAGQDINFQLYTRYYYKDM